MIIDTILLTGCCVLPFINVGIACYTNSKCHNFEVQTTIGEMCVIFLLSIVPIVGFMCLLIVIFLYLMGCFPDFLNRTPSDFFKYKPFVKK